VLIEPIRARRRELGGWPGWGASHPASRHDTRAGGGRRDVVRG